MNIVIVAPGEMGSAMALEMRAKGARMLTSLAGRSAASAARAERAGFIAVADDVQLVAEADFLLSVVPPDRAEAVALRFAPVLTRAAKKPVYVDCNAIAPKAAVRIGEILGENPFADACLFGGPTSGKPGTVIYASGPAAKELLRLAAFGPKVRIVEGGVGAASALKLAFAGLNKGYTALGAAMVLASLRSGSARGLAEQLADSQPAILAYIARFVPAMFPKAGRWAPEMREIAAFLGEDDPDARAMFEAMAPLYERIAAKVAAGDPEIEALARYCNELNSKERQK